MTYMFSPPFGKHMALCTGCPRGPLDDTVFSWWQKSYSLRIKQEVLASTSTSL